MLMSPLDDRNDCCWNPTFPRNFRRLALGFIVLGWVHHFGKCRWIFCTVFPTSQFENVLPFHERGICRRMLELQEIPHSNCRKSAYRATDSVAISSKLWKNGKSRDREPYPSWLGHRSWAAGPAGRTDTPWGLWGPQRARVLMRFQYLSKLR